jgi:hypothetical protein
VAPFDRRSERTLPRRRVAATLRQERQAAVQPSEELVWAERLRTSRGKLDRQRQVVQAATELREVAVLVFLRAPGGACALTKQLDGRSFGERADRILVLAREVQRLSARHDHAHARAGREERGDSRSCFDDLLEVVQDEHEFAVGKMLL